MKLPTAVSTPPSPSVIVNVAVFPATMTDANDPPDGTLANVHGAIPAVYAASVSSNTTVT